MNNAKTITKFPSGTVALPPSKSFCHRAVICAGLAAAGGGGQSTLHNIGQSDDIDATLACMQKLGAAFAKTDENSANVGVAEKENIPAGSSSYIVKAAGGAAENEDIAQALGGGKTDAASTPQPSAAFLNKEPIIMDCAESGSTLRFLLPVAAMGEKEFLFTGRGRLLHRPLTVYENLFAKAGVMYRKGENGITIKGPLCGGHYEVPGNVSSQFISGLLFALPLAKENSTITVTGRLESAAYIDITLEVMKSFGITADCTQNGVYKIKGGQSYKPQEYTVEGDYSQAAFFLAAGALGQNVQCAGLIEKSLQGDAAVIDIIKKTGAEITWQNGAVYARPPENGLSAFNADASEIPDLVPPLAALACFCKGTTRITGAARLRLKESDRLHALATQLARLGANIAEGEDSLTIIGAPALQGGTADAVGDHRIAMALAVAAIKCQNPVSITGWQNVNKSYPAFWQDFEREARNV